ncbi:MAG: 16S rRNA (cytosine(1402)-N(4))-methyltransferase RsmH [Bacteroidota bacterium]
MSEPTAPYMEPYHIPALLEESLDALALRPDGIYVDCTFGGGGHTRAILERLGPKGRLIAFDRDDDAVQNVPDDPRFELVGHSFRFLYRFLRYKNALPVDGILADLGISSHQIDEATRGFAHRFDAPLDMRMDRSAEISAYDVVNRYDEARLIHIFSRYGEITNARKLAAAVVRARYPEPIGTTGELCEAISQCTPAQTRNKYFSQVFQAIRIEVNGELQALEALLEQSAEVLRPGGRLAIISYHSLEDRMVKQFLASGNTAGKQERDLYGNLQRSFDPLQAKAIVPTDSEVNANRRARSARLRCGIKR